MNAETASQASAAVHSVDLLLRILDSTLRTPEKVVLDTAVMAARDRLLDLLVVGFRSVERQLASTDDAGGGGNCQPGDLLRMALKLLRFALGLPRVVVGLNVPKPDFGNLAVSLLRVVVVSSGAA
jgi:hypothetical protein